MKKKKDMISKQKAEQAIPPAPPTFITEAIKEVRGMEKKPKPDDDKILAEGASSDFWRLLKLHIEGKIEQLSEYTTESVARGGYNLEEAGFRYILTDQISHALKDIIHYVEFREKAMLEMEKAEQGRR